MSNMIGMMLLFPTEISNSSIVIRYKSVITSTYKGVILLQINVATSEH